MMRRPPFSPLFPYTTLFRSCARSRQASSRPVAPSASPARAGDAEDRKSTRLNSSHVKISYAVFCLKKKKKGKNTYNTIKQYTYQTFKSDDQKVHYTNQCAIH